MNSARISIIRGRTFRAGLAMAVLLTVAACGSSSNGAASPGATGPSDPELLKVVTTVSPITNIVENIGGTRIQLEGVVPEGVNSHTFAPPPSVARALSRAGLIVLNGLFLESPTLDMAKANKEPEAVILLLGDNAVSQEDWQFDFTFPKTAGVPNPHLWPDPLLALRYAELVEEQLSALDPANEDYYAANLAEFRRRIQELDRGITAAVATIPQAHRKLLTYHDSWAYFARRYGMEVVGAVQPSNFSEPSVGDVVDLISQIKELGLPAVFGSEVFSSDVLETIAREAGAEFIDELADDNLPGVPGDPDHSYLGLMKSNVEIMVSALGGNPASLSNVDTSPVFQGANDVDYPQ